MRRSRWTSVYSLDQFQKEVQIIANLTTKEVPQHIKSSSTSLTTNILSESIETEDLSEKELYIYINQLNKWYKLNINIYESLPDFNMSASVKASNEVILCKCIRNIVTSNKTIFLSKRNRIKSCDALDKHTNSVHFRELVNVLKTTNFKEIYDNIQPMKYMKLLIMGKKHNSFLRDLLHEKREFIDNKFNCESNEIMNIKYFTKDSLMNIQIFNCDFSNYLVQVYGKIADWIVINIDGNDDYEQNIEQISSYFQFNKFWIVHENLKGSSANIKETPNTKIKDFCEMNYLYYTERIDNNIFTLINLLQKNWLKSSDFIRDEFLDASSNPTRKQKQKVEFNSNEYSFDDDFEFSEFEGEDNLMNKSQYKAEFHQEAASSISEDLKLRWYLHKKWSEDLHKTLKKEIK